MARSSRIHLQVVEVSVHHSPLTDWCVKGFYYMSTTSPADTVLALHACQYPLFNDMLDLLMCLRIVAFCYGIEFDTIFYKELKWFVYQTSTYNVVVPIWNNVISFCAIKSANAFKIYIYILLECLDIYIWFWKEYRDNYGLIGNWTVSYFVY